MAILLHTFQRGGKFGDTLASMEMVADRLLQHRSAKSTLFSMSNKDTILWSANQLVQNVGSV